MSGRGWCSRLALELILAALGNRTFISHDSTGDENKTPEEKTFYDIFLPNHSLDLQSSVFRLIVVEVILSRIPINSDRKIKHS